jgi:hypothetical protein
MKLNINIIKIIKTKVKFKIESIKIIFSNNNIKRIITQIIKIIIIIFLII